MQIRRSAERRAKLTAAGAMGVRVRRNACIGAPVHRLLLFDSYLGDMATRASLSRQVLHETIPVLHDVAASPGYEPITLERTSASPLSAGKPAASAGSSV